MKKFFTVVPLQIQNGLKECIYKAVDNQRLAMNESAHFPIIPVLRGYLGPGESCRVIAVLTDNDDSRRNFKLLQEETKAACAAREAFCPQGVEALTVTADDRVAAHVDTFQKLIDFTEDNDELFACMTFGTKPTSVALMAALRYAYRIKSNVSISCLVYGQLDRSVDPPAQSIYDMTALFQVDEIVRILADRQVANPKAVLDSIFSL